MARGWAVWFAALSACGSSGAPRCDEVALSELGVEAGPDGPVFRWSGGAPEFLDVYPGALPPEPTVFGNVDVSNEVRRERVWSLLCQCGDGACGDGGCLPSPLAYGAEPDTDVFVSSDIGPSPLIAGETYTALIGTWCDGPAVTDPVSGARGHVGSKELWTAFVAE